MIKMNIIEKIEDIKKQFYIDLKSVQNLDALEKLRVKFTGRKGLITDLMDLLKGLDLESKRTYGPLVNELKSELSNVIDEKKENLTLSRQTQDLSFDPTLVLPQQDQGSLHPYTQVIRKIEKILISMGYEIVSGPEVETDHYNFEVLNIPQNHPARDEHDTFWLTLPHTLMRTHTSSVQAHMMQNRKPPIAVGIPGRCYRHEATDATHDVMFMQCEIMLIDKDINLSNLFATAKEFLSHLFEKKLEIRVRPSYFPFVEPGVEIDCSCPFCTDGCNICKKTKWIEICGAGLIHPNVLKASNIDPASYSGFAFGFGLTRLVMLMYGINDLRLLTSNKIRFLNQF